MPSGESRNCPKRRLPLIRSRTITSVHRSPTMSSVVAIGQPERKDRAFNSLIGKKVIFSLAFCKSGRFSHLQYPSDWENRDVFEGGCLCGAVRYVCDGEPVMAGHCHCLDCRRSSGTGHASHMAVPAPSVRITGEVARYVSPADSGALVTRAFCPTCGSPVFSTNAGQEGLIFLRASSLDDPEVFEPQMVVYASRAASWDHMDAALPSFAVMPPMG